MLFQDETAAKDFAENHLDVGYELLPCDEPPRGLKGLIGFAKGKDDVILQWPLFGQPLDPDVLMVTPEELVTFIDTAQGVRLYDEPMKLRLGAVQYLPDCGKALVRLVSVSAYKSADSSTRERITAWREEHCHDVTFG